MLREVMWIGVPLNHYKTDRSCTELPVFRMFQLRYLRMTDSRVKFVIGIYHLQQK